jgi:hypothetical protein
LRVAVSNWRTTDRDIEISWNALREAARELHTDIDLPL